MSTKTDYKNLLIKNVLNYLESRKKNKKPLDLMQIIKKNMSIQDLITYILKNDDANNGNLNLNGKEKKYILSLLVDFDYLVLVSRRIFIGHKLKEFFIKHFIEDNNDETLADLISNYFDKIEKKRIKRINNFLVTKDEIFANKLPDIRAFIIFNHFPDIEIPTHFQTDIIDIIKRIQKELPNLYEDLILPKLENRKINIIVPNNNIENNHNKKIVIPKINLNELKSNEKNNEKSDLETFNNNDKSSETINDIIDSLNNVITHNNAKIYDIEDLYKSCLEHDKNFGLKFFKLSFLPFYQIFKAKLIKKIKINF